AWVEDVGQQLLEVAAAVGGDVRPHVLTLTVYLVALAADVLEDHDTGRRVAAALGEEGPHLGDDLFALGVAVLAQRTPDHLYLFGDVRVLAGQELADLVDVEGAGRDPLLGDGLQQRLAPGGSLGQ